MNPHPAQTADVHNNAQSLIANRVYRLGGDILLDERVSWCPPGFRVTQPVNCYLIKGSKGSVLVDTGIRRHGTEVIGQLESLLDPGERLAVVLTRTEMECCLNLPAIEARFDVESVWYTGGITVPRTSATPRRIMINPGTSLEVEVMDGLTLEFVSPLMRLLPTLWIFDPVSRALLTSDAFTHGSYGASNAGAGLRKFQWFSLADTTDIARDVEETVHRLNVKALGPSYGAPIVGHSECSAEASVLAEAIRKVGSQ